MSTPIIQHIVEIVKNLTTLGNKLVDSTDAEKYSKGVHSLNQNIEETYSKMRELIVNDTTLSVEQKEEKLYSLANSQLKAKERCQEAIQGNKESVARVTAEIILALSTCGISYIPKLVNQNKKYNDVNKLE